MYNYCTHTRTLYIQSVMYIHLQSLHVHKSLHVHVHTLIKPSLYLIVYTIEVWNHVVAL